MTTSTTTHQTPSAQAKTATPSGTEAGAPGEEVEPRSPATPSRPAATDRVTWESPFAVEQDVQDESWTVTIGLTDDAARQLARDLTRRHMADLVLLARLQATIRRPGASAADVEEHHHVMQRLSGALQSMATTQWVLTPAQAEAVLDDLEDANTEPTECAVGTCDAFSMPAGSYCAPHDGVL